MRGSNRLKFSIAQLDAMFRPKSVAIIGASPKEGSARNRIVKIVIKHGFEGLIYPVTPSNTEVEGLTAYKTVADLPEVPDVALIITPAATVPAIIEECGRKGIRNAMVFSAGFEEVDGGQLLADALAEAANRHGMAVLGANGQGAWSVAAKAMLTFGGGAYAVNTLQHSPIAIISQSGALAGAIGVYLQKNAIGCSYIISVGNETVMDALDALAWVIEQDDVHVVALYLEGLDDGHRLVTLAARARERGVQIVALKTGRSSFGQEATSSHTGKIASPYAIYREVLDQAGVLVVTSLGEALAAVEIFAMMPDPRDAGTSDSGVAILSSSGGAGALLADHGEEAELPMARFGDDTVAKLNAVLPEFARKQNPIDLTGQVRGNPNLFRDSLAIIAADPRTEAFVIQFSSSGMRDLTDNAEVFKQAARNTALPMVITFAAEKLDVETRAEFRDAGILLSEDPADSMRALSWLYRRRAWRSLPAPCERGALTARPAPVDWAETMDFLVEAGVTPAPWVVLEAGQVAADACAELKFPLVVKALPSEAEHKTEMGLVRLRVTSAEQVDAIAGEFRKIVGKPDMGVLVQEMVGSSVEVVLSCLRDTDFGPVLSIGSGGVAIELYRDVTFLALPTTPEQVKRALARLKLETLLKGFRGAAAADIDALAKAATQLGDLFLATPGLTEFEVNPVMVRPEAHGIAAVDCLVVTAEG
jgi:acetate---CoA ligase (ADP-forming)